MLALRRAQLEQELEEYLTKLQGVEPRLRYFEGENAMPADDITVKKVPELGVVAIAAPAPSWDPIHVVPVVNTARAQFDELNIAGRAKVNGPFMVFFAGHGQGDDVTVFLALPVAEPPAELSPTVEYMVLPAIEAATAVRNGKASSIYPAVYHDLVQWCSAQGFQTSGPGRDPALGIPDEPLALPAPPERRGLEAGRDECIAATFRGGHNLYGRD